MCFWFPSALSNVGWWVRTTGKIELVPDDRENANESLEQLESEERRLSKRRARLHERIRFAQTMGDGTGNPVSAEELEELNAQEREVSKARKELHTRIDALRQRRL